MVVLQLSLGLTMTGLIMTNRVMKNTKLFFQFALVLLIFTSNSSYAICEEKANLYRSVQSVFTYANHYGDKWYLLDREQRIYLASFHEKEMSIQKIGDFDSSVFLHFSKRKGFLWLASNTWREDSNKYLQRKLGDRVVDFDTFLDLSVGNSEIALFLGSFPRYIVVYDNGTIQIRDWSSPGKNDYFLGAYSKDDTFVVLVVRDETVHFYFSGDGYIWDKSDFSIPSYVRGYTHNNLFWVVDDQGEKYSSEDGLDWQMNMDDHSFNQYEAEYDTHRARLLTKLRESNYIVNSIDGDHNEGVVVGSCYKRVGPKIENMGFLLRYKNNQYTMYEDFDNKKPLTFVGKSWELGSE